MPGLVVQDFYALLGVSGDASVEEVKRAYRKLAVELHPDRNQTPGAEDRFKEITLAYQTLSSPARRKRYDEERLRSTRRVVLWKGPPARTRGDDLTYRLEISFEEAVLGAMRNIQFPRKATCGECGGSGAELERAPSRIPPCADCGGRGKIEGDGARRPRACERCQGRGLEPIEACNACNGEGRRGQTDTLDVPIPAGIETGRRLRLSGWGDDGPGPGDNGNLLVVVTVADHPLLRRDGDDVLIDVPISFAQALIGDEITVPTVDGLVEVKVPPGSNDGTQLKLKGRGVMRPDATRGNQIVKLEVVMPGALTEEQRKALAAFAKARPPEEELRIRQFRETVAGLQQPVRKLEPGRG